MINKWINIGWSKFPAAFVGPRAQQLGIDLLAISVRSSRVRELLEPHSFDYTIVEAGPGGHRAEQTISALREIIVRTKETQRAVQEIATADLVTIVVTPNGYEPHDSAISLLHDGLLQRFRLGLEPNVVMSLDNTRGVANGQKLKDGLITIARQQHDPKEFLDYLTRVFMPNTVVDRITADAGQIGKQFVVLTEKMPKHSLVIEISESADISERQRDVVMTLASTQGAQITSDIKPWMDLKNYFINRTHALIALMRRGNRFAHQVAGNRLIEEALRDCMAVLPSIPGLDIDEYADETIKRISNDQIKESISRLALGIPEKYLRILEPILEAARRGDRSQTGPTIVALYANYLACLRSRDIPLSPSDQAARNSRLLKFPGYVYEDAREFLKAVVGLEQLRGIPERFFTEVQIQMERVPALDVWSPAIEAAELAISLGPTS